MAKTQTVITTPNRRPSRLGNDIELTLLDDVDAALEEVSYLQQKRSAIEADLKELHDAIDLKRDALLSLTIEGLATTLEDREQVLTEHIEQWASEHLKQHLPDGERAVQLEHGSVSVRKLPLSIEPLPATVAAAAKAKISVAELVLGKIDAQASCLTKARGICAVWFVRATQLLLGDVIKVEVKLNQSGQLAAYRAKKLDNATLKAIGLVAIDNAEEFGFKVK